MNRLENYQDFGHPHQHTARMLLQISPILNQIYLDQWHYLSEINAQNMLELDAEQHRLSLANGMLCLDFSVEHPVIQRKYQYPDLNYDKLEHFILTEVPFFTGDLSAHHPTTIKTKAHVLRQTLIEQVFVWVDGENRVEQFLYNIQLPDAVAIDELLIEQNYYHDAHLTAFVQQGTTIPLAVEINLKHLCLVNSVQGEFFIQVNALVQHLDRLSYQANQFMPNSLLRLLEVRYKEQFILDQLLDEQRDFTLLAQHAAEVPHLLGYSRLAQRGHWQRQDLLSKQQFLSEQPGYWDEIQLRHFPLIHYSRTVNWLFRQPAMINDWLSQNINHPGAKVAVTALSFIDTASIAPQVILLTLKYFKQISARILLWECHHYAEKEQWFCQENLSAADIESHLTQNTQVVQTPIKNSILYIEEWQNFLRQKNQQVPQTAKRVYSQLSRVMQAYMRFLQQICDKLPADLVRFIDPESHQHPELFQLLKQHHLKMDDFRHYFRHAIRPGQANHTVFDREVADYLIVSFQEGRHFSKNTSWNALYSQSCHWHHHLMLEDMIRQLKFRVSIDEWPRISPMEQMFFAGWRYQELHSLQQIIDESLHFKHCLAVSYAERIAEHQYVAFSMQHIQQADLKFTLGCVYQFGRLSFDQLRQMNNVIPDTYMINQAKDFIDELNDYLNVESYHPELASLERFQ